MVLALIAILLPLLSSPAWPNATGNDLVVRVVDTDGKPVAGIQVGLCPHWSGHSNTSGIGVSDAEGTARLEGVLNLVRSDTSHEYFVRLGMPAEPDVRFELDRAHLDEAHPTLVVPAHGRLVLRLPAVVEDGCTARVRSVPTSGEERGAIWSGSSLPQIRCVNGVATCEFVGLGLDLEFEVLGKSVPAPLRGTCKGPTTKGQTVEFVVRGFEGRPTLTATLVDGSLTPIRDLQFDWSIGISSGNGGSSNGGHVRSNEKGRVQIPLMGALAEPGARQLSINAWSDDSSAQRLGDAYVSQPIPPDFTSGALELGELIVVPFGAPERFLRMDDDALRHALEAPRRISRSCRNEGDAFEEILCEVVRRGGPAWQRYVADRLTQVRAAQDPLHPPDIAELELLTTLRRLQHKPDPLKLEIAPRSVLAVTFPRAPRLELSLKNVDSERESFEVTEGGSYRSGRFGRCNVEAVGPDGKRVPPREWDSSIGGGFQGSKRLAPGESTDVAIRLDDFVTLAAAGEYRVLVRYHNREDIDHVTDLRGRILSSSAEFLVHVLPCQITITRARLDETRTWTQQLDTQKDVPLVSDHWREDQRFVGEARGPEDKLFRAGYQAVPALMEIVSDPNATREKLAWGFGMLWNIFGIECPVTRSGACEPGHYEWVAKWPSSAEEVAPRAWIPGPSPTSIDPEARAKLVHAWKKWKSLIEVKIVP